MTTSIPRRNMDFEFDPARVPRDWYRDDPYITSMLDALSLLFPEGERFFIDAVKKLRHHVADPALDAAIDGFIGQEAFHGKEHRAFNELLRARGGRAAPRVGRQLSWLLGTARKVLSPRSQLAATIALEHFTAMMTEAVLRKAPMRDGMHETMRPLWVWHSLEETEHKAVAFDVYVAAGGGYVRRAAIMLLTTVIFFAFTLWVQANLLAERRTLWKPWRLAWGVGHLWIWPGWFTRLVPTYFTYFRPGFHPDERDTAALVDEWRERLFGDRGELVPQLRGKAA